MCEPTTIAMSLAAVGGIYSAYSQMQAGKINQQVANNNAVINDFLAEDAIERGQINANEHRQKTRQLKGEQKAVMGASGVDVNSGSYRDVRADTDAMGELDALRILDGAEREAWQYRQGAQDLRTQGSIDRKNANQGAIGTLLGSGAKVASMWTPSP